MDGFDTRTFRSGDTVALALPPKLGVGPDEAMRVERRGGEILVTRAVVGETDALDRNRALAERLRALGPPLPSIARDPDIFPNRAGL